MNLNSKEVDHRLLTKPIRFQREITKAVAALDKTLKQIKVKLKNLKLGNNKQETGKLNNPRVHLVVPRTMMTKILRRRRSLRKMESKISRKKLRDR